MLISLPRMLRISWSFSSNSSRPPKRIEPASLAGGSGIRRRTDIAVTDLPQPLSPTTASVSPSFTCNETPLTARLTPSDVRNCTCRFSISSSAIGLKILGQARVESVAQPVAEQVHGENRDRQECRREEDDKGLYLPQRAAVGHDVAP